MKRSIRHLLSLTLIAALICFCAACDNGKSSADGQLMPPDLGPQVDPGSCAGIIECLSICPEDKQPLCSDECIANGTTSGQQLYNAVITCEKSAKETTCQQACAEGDTETCADCLDPACKTVWDACLADS